jgi:putative transposase
LSSALLKMTVETALGSEMEHHLGYPKHEQGGAYGNTRNGYGSKTLKGDHSEIELSIPRDRNDDFEPVILGKGQTRLT